MIELLIILILCGGCLFWRSKFKKAEKAIDDWRNATIYAQMHGIISGNLVCLNFKGLDIGSAHTLIFNGWPEHIDLGKVIANALAAVRCENLPLDVDVTREDGAIKVKLTKMPSLEAK